MPYALVIIGLVLIVTGVRNTHLQLATQLQNDAIPFTKTAVAIGSVGALGYVSELQAFSRVFMALIIISLLLANKGFFTQLKNAVNQGPVASSPDGGTTAPATSTPSPKSDTNRSPLGAFFDGFFK